MSLIEKIGIGFGKKETAKTAKGAVVGGVGAFVYSLLSGLDLMPSALTTPDVVPYVVAGLAAVINFVRHFFTDHLS